jgi:hypothetical protein
VIARPHTGGAGPANSKVPTRPLTPGGTKVTMPLGPTVTCWSPIVTAIFWENSCCDLVRDRGGAQVADGDGRGGAVPHGNLLLLRAGWRGSAGERLEKENTRQIFPFSSPAGTGMRHSFRIPPPFQDFLRYSMEIPPPVPHPHRIPALFSRKFYEIYRLPGEMCRLPEPACGSFSLLCRVTASIRGRFSSAGGVQGSPATCRIAARSASRFTGLVRCRAKPASWLRRMSSSMP